MCKLKKKEKQKTTCDSYCVRHVGMVGHGNWVGRERGSEGERGRRTKVQAPICCCFAQAHPRRAARSSSAAKHRAATQWHACALTHRALTSKTSRSGTSSAALRSCAFQHIMILVLLVVVMLASALVVTTRCAAGSTLVGSSTQRCA